MINKIVLDGANKNFFEKEKEEAIRRFIAGAEENNIDLSDPEVIQYIDKLKSLTYEKYKDKFFAEFVSRYWRDYIKTDPKSN